MATEKQVRTNRANARKSTGPRTPRGKAVASRNATRHGLRAADLVIRGESETEFRAVRRSLWATLRPAGALEEMLADTVVAAAWRLRRVRRWEGEMVVYHVQLEANVRMAYPRAYEVEPALTEGGAVGKHLGGNGEYADFRRYEGHVERSLYRALHELQRAQARRMGEQVSAPAVLDIDVNTEAA